ncbi:MAG TPA: hypothetical protein VGO47_14995 [Chlamydiales bacterium]|nr:hypothetical protein [Chlamydiales bacterium]
MLLDVFGSGSPPGYTSIDLVHRSPSHPIIDRYYGETAMLSDLPDAEDVLIRNLDLPALRGEELRDSMKDLDSIRGIPSPQFWRTVDMCECGHWFTKRVLHDDHRKICPAWASIPEAVSRSPVTSSDDVERSITVASPGSSLGSPIQHRYQPLPSASARSFRQRPPTLFSRQPQRSTHISPYGKPFPVALGPENKDRVTNNDSIPGTSSTSWVLRETNTSLNTPKTPTPSDESQYSRAMTASASTSRTYIAASTQLQGSVQKEHRTAHLTVPRPSSNSQPVPPIEHPGDMSPTRTPSDVSSFNASQSDVSFNTSEGSSQMHTIHDDVLNTYLDSIVFDTLGAGGVPDGNN